MRVIIHIGAPKTGTTSIQSFLAQNRAALAERGIVYPASLGPLSHVNTAVCVHETVNGFVRTKAPSVRTESDLAAFKASQHRQLWQEIDAAVEARMLLVSAESLFPHVSTRQQVGALLALLGAPADAVTLVVYLRRPDLFAAAVHAEAVRMGAGHGVDRDLRSERTRTLLDYPARIRPWIEALGGKAIVLRVYEKARLHGGDVVTDFCRILGLEADDPAFVRPAPSRPSLGAGSTDFLRRFNAAVIKLIEGKETAVPAETFKSIRCRSEIVAALQPFDTSSYRLNPGQAKAIVDLYRAPTAELLRMFGQEDFDYTELDREGDLEPPLSRDAFAEIAARLWLQNEAQILALRARLGEPADGTLAQHKTPSA